MEVHVLFNNTPIKSKWPDCWYSGPHSIGPQQGLKRWRGRRKRAVDLFLEVFSGSPPDKNHHWAKKCCHAYFTARREKSVLQACERWEDEGTMEVAPYLLRSEVDGTGSIRCEQRKKMKTLKKEGKATLLTSLPQCRRILSISVSGAVTPLFRLTSSSRSLRVWVEGGRAKDGTQKKERMAARRVVIRRTPVIWGLSIHLSLRSLLWYWQASQWGNYPGGQLKSFFPLSSLLDKRTINTVAMVGT